MIQCSLVGAGLGEAGLGEAGLGEAGLGEAGLGKASLVSRVLLAQAGDASPPGDAPDTLRSAASDALRAILEFLPRLALAIVILAAGLLLAWLVGRAIASICKRLSLNEAADRAGLRNALAQVGIEREASDVLATIVFYLILVVAAFLAIDSLDVVQIDHAVHTVMVYLPRVLAAALLVVLGLLVAGLVRNPVESLAEHQHWRNARQLGQVTYALLVILVLVAALDQLQIELRLFHHAVLIALAGLALAFGLSFGLGGRSVAEGWMAGHFLRQRLQPGDRVQFRDVEGTVREIGAVATVVEEEEEGLLRRRSIPNTQMLNEAVRR